DRHHGKHGGSGEHAGRAEPAAAGAAVGGHVGGVLGAQVGVVLQAGEAVPELAGFVEGVGVARVFAQPAVQAVLARGVAAGGAPGKVLGGLFGDAVAGPVHVLGSDA